MGGTGARGCFSCTSCHTSNTGPCPSCASHQYVNPGSACVTPHPHSIPSRPPPPAPPPAAHNSIWLGCCRTTARHHHRRRVKTHLAACHFSTPLRKNGGLALYSAAAADTDPFASIFIWIPATSLGRFPLIKKKVRPVAIMQGWT